MKKTPFAIIALIGVAVLAGYAVCNRPSRTHAPSVDVAAPDVSQPLDADSRAIINELCKKWDRVEKLSAAIRTTSPSAAGMKGTTKGEGDYAYQKTDGNPLIRLHLRNMMRIEKETTLPDGRKSPLILTGEVLIYLSDGQYLWQTITQPDYKRLYKRRYDPAEVLQLGGRALWDTLTDGTILERLADEKVKEVENKDAYVFSITPMDGDWTSIHWFDKETGLRLKTVEKDAQGKETLTLWLENIDFDPQFDPDRFVFKIPEGYEVIDQTGENGTTKEKSP